MKDANKTKKQLLEELSALRRRLARLNGSEASSIPETHYRSMVEASPVSIMAIRNGRLLFSNPAGARMLGFSHPNEMVGIPAIDVVAHESQQLVAKRINRLESGKDNPADEVMLIRQDGTKIIVVTISVPINIDGIPSAVIIAHDVSKRKELETKLKESEERFRAFMDNIPASVYIKDENDIHIYANAAASKSTKKKLEELVGSTTRELWPPDLADRLIELDQQVIDNDVPKITEEWKIREKGDARWQRDIKFPIILESGTKLLGGISLDITEIKLSEQKLRKAYEEIKLLKQRLEHENIYLREEIELHHRHEEIIGNSEPIIEMLDSAEQVAEAEATVLILGETGTGKELLARAIHSTSARKPRPMIKVNCAALPPTLIETELFGREKGAYTGALTKQKGRFELADGSTIFLDEISELPLELQPKLLRVLQEGSFERLGSSKTITVDARIMAATNQDLSEMVRNGRFREDLYYRLNVFPITVPPLRERQEDIPMLVWAFVKEFEETMARRIKRIPRKSMEALQHYPWPGNVRELRNVIEQAMIISKDEVLNVRVPALSDLITEPEIKLVDVERKHILKMLHNTGWRIKGQNGAAELLNLHPATLYSKMKRLGIQRPA